MTSREIEQIDFRVRLGMCLSKQRGLAGLTMRDVVKKTGISLGAISKIERGEVEAGIFNVILLFRAAGLTNRQAGTIIHLCAQEAQPS